jgi:predicted MFS family arabinose efflux permease
MFALVRTLHGIPFGAVTVSNSTVAIDVLPSSRRNEGIGFYGLSGNIGMAIAPSLGIYLHNLTNSYAILFWIAFVCSSLSVILSFFVKIPEKEIVKNKRKLSLDRFFLTKAWLMAINIALFGLCFGTLSNYLAIYSKEELGITNGTGTYFMILAIGLILSRFQGAKSLRQGKLTENAAQGMVLSLCGYVVFAAFHSLPFYYLSAILIGLGNGHMYPAFLNMFINVARHDERGTANSSILTSWDFGFGIGILIGGIISEYSGFSAAFWTVAIINAVGVILFFAGTRSFFLSRRRME